MGLMCKSCIDNIQNTIIKLNHYINEIPEGIEVVLMYYEDIKYPLALNELVRHLSYVKNEFMYQNPFFSNKTGVIEYNSANVKFNENSMYIEHKMLIDKNVYNIKQIEDILNRGN